MAIKASAKVLGDNKIMWLFDYKKDKVEEKKLPESIHHIQILDRSGSMWGSINQLMEDCKKTITQMHETDYYTVIWFSSAGEFRTVLKGIKNDEANREASFRVLDSLKHTVGCTCFSESVKETETIVDELTALCPNFSVTLFTDGEAVVPWGEREEYKRVQDILDRLKDKILAFNTIGYGNYCNEDVLNQWAATSQFGEFIHSGRIDEYHNIFESNMTKARNLEKDNVTFNIDNTDIYYFTSKSVNKYHEKINLNHIDKKTNQFVVITDSNVHDISGEINGESFDYSFVTVNTIAKTRMDSLIYKLALAEYCYGDRYESMCLLGSVLRDKPLTDGQISAFTPDEKESYKKKLKAAAFRNVGRNKNTARENYVPSENTPCLLDLLGKLSSSSKNLYVVSNNYKRIGRATTDDFNMFKKTSKEVTVPIENITFNEKRLNISIRFEIPGTVSINPKQASKVNLPSEYSCKISRNYTIVKDGFLNMEEMTLIVDSDTIDYITKNYGKEAIKNASHIDGNMTRIIFDLTAIPIVNAAMGKASIEEVFELVNKENKLKAELKLSKELNKNIKTWEQEKYTEEQCTLLEEYGIKNGLYNGIKTSVPKVENSDYYMGKVFELSLKGFSKLSSIKMEDGKPTIEKPANGDAYLMKAINDMENNKLPYPSDIKKELSTVRAELAGIRIAKILCGKWFEQEKLSDTNKDEVKTYTAHVDELDKDLVLNVKTTYEKCYF